MITGALELPLPPRQVRPVLGEKPGPDAVGVRVGAIVEGAFGGGAQRRGTGTVKLGLPMGIFSVVERAV
ncbi:hypothetical protein GCM10012279_32620 [Micromonospora yangpuensis]|uniref:Uncharacterized protein n=1 Tax=Micromonospora yangpuensis TaxID=683228 RepID=A0A1C6U040_9ACTN|nr:hypothetical protein GCM10012279_32620 [Micromonospora yangpuensis]SCL47442.1 hypothetical protein GA0070617_0582 [Micromonospora yangpuensis]